MWRSILRATAVALALGVLPASCALIRGAKEEQPKAPQRTVLIAPGATWKYLDDGSDQGTAWTGKDFDDSAWNSGAAPLGYGDAGMATEVSYGADGRNKYITTYFRHTFELPGGPAHQELAVRIRRDDGVVVYLNGAEIARSNMPTGPVDSSTQALETVGGADEKEFFEFIVDAAALAKGKNVLAVELHQIHGRSSDLALDLELIASPSATGTAQEPDESGSAVTMNFIAAGSTWKYLDDGSDQGTAWRAADFEDSAWNSGRAKLGFGDAGMATELSYGPDGRNKYTTTYLRHAFEVKKASACKSLQLRILRDDGAIVYLSGKEIYRTNMPDGPVSHTTFASKTVGGQDETKFFETTLDATDLQKGKNVLAVELHQCNARSTDLGFDLELSGSSKKKLQ